MHLGYHNRSFDMRTLAYRGVAIYRCLRNRNISLTLQVVRVFLGLYCTLLKTAVRSNLESVEQPGILTILSTRAGVSTTNCDYGWQAITYLMLP